jgi:ABC-2 type transport system permease protein
MARHNLRTVISFEVVRTLTKKRFWIATLIVPVALGIVGGLVALSSSATDSSVNSQKTAKFSFSYIDASGDVSPAVVTSLGGTKAASANQAIAEVKNGKLDAFFDYPANPTKQHTKVYGADEGIFANGKYSSVATQILVASAQAKIGDPTLAKLVQGSVSVDSTTYKAGEKSSGINGVIPPLIFLVLFYVVILLLGNQMLTSTLEEKENRVTEMILVTMSATTLVVGKVVSLFIVGLVQIVVFAVPVAVGFLFFRQTLNLPNFDLSALTFNPEQMIVGALLLLGGFVLFTGTLVAVGALMPTVKEAGPVFGIMMALIFIPFYTVALVVSDPSAPIVQIFTYFPYSAPVTAMLRNGFGSLTLLESAIVIVEVFAIGIIVLRFGVRLFQYGSIEYARKVSLKTVIARRR